jgi:hypothetical protein
MSCRQSPCMNSISSGLPSAACSLLPPDTEMHGAPLQQLSSAMHPAQVQPANKPFAAPFYSTKRHAHT